IKIFIIKFVQIYSLNNAKEVIFLSDYARKTITKYLRKNISYNIIPHGVEENFKKIDLEKLNNTTWNYNSKKKIKIIYVSPLFLYKNHQTVVKAYSRLKKKYDNLEIEFIGNYKHNLKLYNNLIDENSLINESHFIGELNRKDLIKTLIESDIFVFASSTETFGISLLEAMAVGMPIVCSDKSSLPEVLQNGGLYFDPKDDLQLSNQIELLITNEILRKNKSQQARKLALKFSWDQNTEQFCEILKKFDNTDPLTYPSDPEQTRILTNINNSYQMCEKLVLDTTYPGIKFDKNGISSHYWDYQDNIKDKWKVNQERTFELEKIVEEIKKKGSGKEFDCILGLSGGADSSYMLHTIVKKFDLKPLVFHVDGGWNSEIAVSNIRNLVDKLGLDLFTEVINWEEMKDFQLAMFKSGVPHIDIPQDMAFIAVLYKFAKKYNIPYILNGGNISTECVQRPLDIIYWGTDMRHIKDILKKFSNNKMESFPFSSAFYHKLYLRYYKNIKVIKPLNYIKYIKKDAMNLMSDLYDWKPYPQKHFESRFTRFFEGYWLPTRFKFDMRTVDLSSLILTGQITRDQAIEELKKPPYDTDLIDQDFQYIAKKLNIDSSELKKFHEMPKKYWMDYKNLNNVFKISEKILQLISETRRGGSF
ncbi:N-acetyl sugar amidotransferase, partial [Candidatus Pelagibacter sp.]|nr:N-acetyl sugar amidotransferase [Candidatus Pelagibacter sp.]